MKRSSLINENRQYDIVWEFNFRTFVKLLLLLLILAILAYIDYWLIKGMGWVINCIWNGAYWLAVQKTWAFVFLLSILAIWGLSKANWKNIN